MSMFSAHDEGLLCMLGQYDATKLILVKMSSLQTYFQWHTVAMAEVLFHVCTAVSTVCLCLQQHWHGLFILIASVYIFSHLASVVNASNKVYVMFICSSVRWRTVCSVCSIDVHNYKPKDTSKWSGYQTWRNCCVTRLMKGNLETKKMKAN